MQQRPWRSRDFACTSRTALSIDAIGLNHMDRVSTTDWFLKPWQMVQFKCLKYCVKQVEKLGIIGPICRESYGLAYFVAGLYQQQQKLLVNLESLQLLMSGWLHGMPLQHTTDLAPPSFFKLSAGGCEITNKQKPLVPQSLITRMQTYCIHSVTHVIQNSRNFCKRLEPSNCLLLLNVSKDLYF